MAARVRAEETISRYAKRCSSRVGTRIIGSISRWITFEADLTTQRVHSSQQVLGEDLARSMVGFAKRASREREEESKFDERAGKTKRPG